MHFWSLHFEPFLDLVPKLILLLGESLFFVVIFKMVPVINPVTENAEVANGMHYLLMWLIK